jgi:hypothetical protein
MKKIVEQKRTSFPSFSLLTLSLFFVPGNGRSMKRPLRRTLVRSGRLFGYTPNLKSSAI